MEELATNGSSGLTSIIVEALTYFRTAEASNLEPSTYPDMELMYTPLDLSCDQGLFFKKLFRFSDEIYDQFWKPNEGKNMFMIVPMHLRPKSTGSLRLRSKDPADPPIIKYYFLSHPSDVRAFVEAIRVVLGITRTKAFQKYGATIVQRKIPGCEEYKFNSYEYWECGVRTLSASLWHQVSTCKMGSEDDADAIVDNKCRVYGVQGLRVADCSIVPVSPAAHTQVVSYMIGEKTADIIKDDWDILEKQTTA